MMDLRNGHICLDDEQLKEYADSRKESMEELEENMVPLTQHEVDQYEKMTGKERLDAYGEKHSRPLTHQEGADLRERFGNTSRMNSMRNQPCMCGSKKKFKKCCMNKLTRRRKNA